jgi:serine/threonine protein kinase
VTADGALEDLLARWVEHHLRTGERLALGDVCAERPELLADLRRAVARYERLEETLSRAAGSAPAEARIASAGLPTFAGFRTIEKLGEGGQGSVYKLEDLRLGRLVAGKVLRPDSPARTTVRDFLGEARSLALFKDPRIVAVHELREDAGRPLLVMELVDGFPVTQVAPSLDVAHRARLVAEIAEAVERAHSLGIQHRDLKPANILLDSRLQPKILDFGLAGADPARGHLRGTVPYLAPEQLDPTQPIDARTDVHALGVILYELLCGSRPYGGASADAVLEEIRAGRPRLPVEVDPTVPEPLQAVALKAMEHDPALRHGSAREMAQDLRRALAGRPVLARPSLYDRTLEQRVRPHLEQVSEWLRLKLIHPHEAARIEQAYRQLEAREDDWILQSRSLSYSQIALYLGAFVLLLGGLSTLGVHRVFETVEGLAPPTLTLALPALLLTVAAHALERGPHRAVAVALRVASLALVPLYALIAQHELGLFPLDDDARWQLLEDLDLSNRQLQVALLCGCAAGAWMAERTRTVAVSSILTALLVMAWLAFLADLGLEEWLEPGRRDLLAAWLLPLLAGLVGLAVACDHTRRAHAAQPLWVGAAVVLVAALELAALDGQLMAHAGVSLHPRWGSGAADPLLLDTLAAMTLGGVLIHLAGWGLDRRAPASAHAASWLLVVISPAAILEPLAWLNETRDYARGACWAYLLLGLAITVLSHHRQRRSFYYTGLVNVAVALWFLADRYEWLDEPAWAQALVAAGLLALLLGFGLHVLEARRGRPGGA